MTNFLEGLIEASSRQNADPSLAITDDDVRAVFVDILVSGLCAAHRVADSLSDTDTFTDIVSRHV